jgi:Tfp pilus assembly protein FimT
MISQKDRHCTLSINGFTVVELMIVFVVLAVLTGLAVPQMIALRRLTRSTAVTREIMTQMRYARQLALSRRSAFTFQYDDATKQIKVIGPIPAGKDALLSGTGYPNNAGSRVITTVPLAQAGLQSSDISTGIPSGLAGSPYSVDGVTGTALSGGKLNITFQPDGSVIDSAGNLVDSGLFFYNNLAPDGTASAITVRGASGRVKIWRYTLNANANASKYAE